MAGLLVETCLMLALLAAPSAAFDVRGHLSSRTTYDHAQPVPGSLLPAERPLPAGSRPLYWYHVVRHGTRWPTRKRMAQYLSLEPLLQEAQATRQHPWLVGWASPFRDEATNAGLLHPIGEVEMQQLGAWLRRLLPTLFEAPYSPLQTALVSTQKHRASASAVALAQGLFPCAPAAGPGRAGAACACRPQPVALSMQPLHEDMLLRFFKLCPGYAAYKREIQPRLRAWELAACEPLVGPLQQRLGLPPGRVRPEHVAALWQLCQQEAALLGCSDRLCSLFSEQEALLMEYVADVVLFEAKAHATCVGYASAAPLMADMLQRLAQAAAQGGSAASERARIQVAHAETVAPFAALLGLFGSPGPCLVNHSQEACSQAWAAALPPPPQPRAWSGAAAIPFGANIGLLLHEDPAAGPCVRLLVNGRVVPQPACGSAWDCPLPAFLEAFAVDWEAMFEGACHTDRPCPVPA